MIIGFLLNLVRKSLQIELDDYLDAIHEPQVTKQAFIKARNKLKPEAFLCLNQTLVKEFYTDNEIETYKGYLLLSCDGSTLQLPNTPAFIEEFGQPVNQQGKGDPLAGISVLYDQLNGITLDGILSSYPAKERALAKSHLDNVAPVLKDIKKKLSLFDMGYPGFEFMYSLIHQGYDFLIRCPQNFVEEFERMIRHGINDIILDFPIAERHYSVIKQFRQFVPHLKE
ncbi:hypothetical protein WDW89_05465, partial [Deltaproteobacteria bacterium TL4]